MVACLHEPVRFVLLPAHPFPRLRFLAQVREASPARAALVVENMYTALPPEDRTHVVAAHVATLAACDHTHPSEARALVQATLAHRDVSALVKVCVLPRRHTRLVPTLTLTHS